LAYALIVITVTTYGAVSTQHVARFSNYYDCAAFAVAWVAGQPRHQGETVQWHCEREKP
jgi:hypothetical protein